MAKKPILNKDTAETLDNMNPSISKGEVSADSVSKTAPTNGYVAAGEMKDEKLPKNVTNVSKVAELVGDVSTSASGTGGPTRGAMRAISFSGTSESIIGDRSDSVIAAKANRSGGRPERKLDTALMHVDDTPAETYKVPVKTIPNIKSNDPVGYNGVYRNEHAISGKASGGSPKDGDFFRTVDLVEHDTFYYTHGQNNFAQAEDARVISYPQYDKANNQFDSNKNVYLGNYTNDTLTIKFGEDNTGRKIVNDIQFTSNDHSVCIDESTARLASDAALRNEHIDELDRLAMVDKAGNENDDNFSPLGMAIKGASATNRMLKAMDAIIGSYIAVSGDKLGKALAFQINKTAKDGVRKVGPMFEMCLGNVDSAYNDRLDVRLRDWYSENANILTELFGQGAGAKGKDYNAKGSAALYVAFHDSLAKYNTKSKLLSLPLSFKTAYNSFKANSGIFKTTETLVKEYARQEVFGKVDEDGTGITPVLMSDGVKLITPLPFSAFGDVTPGTVTKVGNNYISGGCVLQDMMTIHFENLRNKYDYDVYNYLTQGLIDYFNRHANKICNFLPDAVNGIQTLAIPVISTQHCLSLWDLILCEALPDIVRHRKYAMEILNEYEDMNGYPYSGLVPVSELTTPNVGFADINSTLSTKNIPLTTAVRFIMPEVFSVIGDIANDDLSGTSNEYQIAKTVLPWYFSQDQFEDVQLSTGARAWMPKFLEGSRMSFFDRRDGVTWNNIDRVLDMDPEQLKLAMDRMVVYPGMFSIPDTNNNVGATPHTAYDTEYDANPSQVYKHAGHDDGIPIVNYKAYAGSAGNVNHCLTINDIISTPRELGLSFIAPDGVITPTKLAYINGGNKYEYQHYRQYSDGYLSYSGPGFRAYLWAKIINADNTELADPQIDKTAGAAYSAHYHTIFSNPVDANKDIGIIFNINAQKETNHVSNGTYVLDAIDKPIAEVTSNSNFDAATGLYGDAEAKVTTAKESNIGVVNLSKYLWTRLNILPYLINPFDINTAVITWGHYSGNKWRGNYKYDPMEFIYLFNVCGIRCGEYSTSEYDRCESRIQRGLGYTEDPYIQRRL